MSNGKSYMPKILTFITDKKFTHQGMEDEIAKYSLNGWRIVSMTHFPSDPSAFTVLLEYEFSEEEMSENREKRA